MDAKQKMMELIKNKKSEAKAKHNTNAVAKNDGKFMRKGPVLHK